MKLILIAALVLTLTSTARAAESMASHEAHTGQSAAEPAERADDGENPEYTDPNDPNVIDLHDWAVSTDGEMHDFGPTFTDDGSDNQGVDEEDTQP